MDAAGPEELILRPRPWKWGGLLLVSLGFTTVGVMMSLGGRTVGWFVAGFFGLCTLGALLILMPGAAFLKLNRRGFTVRSLYRSWSLRWDEVEYFRVARIGGNSMVVFDQTGPPTTGRNLSAALTGAESGLPDTYGMKPQALADMMNAWRERALGTGV